MEKRHIYMDNAATTPLSQPVWEAMLPWLREGYGNPSAVYRKGREARRAVEAARRQVAIALGAASHTEIFFTSGGTEADNWAVFSGARLALARGKTRVVTTAIEHKAVLESVRTLEQLGVSHTIVGATGDGVVDPAAVEAALGEDVGLVSVMWANNEVGSLQPVEAIGRLCRQRGILFHTDAVQAAGKLPIHLQELPVDMLSLSAHKFHGPKGVGALYVRGGTALPPYLHGGGQEHHRRAGTENVAGIVGLGEALAQAVAHLNEHSRALTRLSDRLLEGLLQIPGSHRNGSGSRCLPGIVNVSFEGVEGESLLLMLDLDGIAASSGSACTTGDPAASHVLLAMGIPEPLAKGSLRLSLSADTTAAEVDRTVEAVAHIVHKLRGYTMKS
ncbi:cysteine desulfurase [Ruminococcaceae bacterium OttesenSCG-928-L11]|nr:cysteine desulfurase [Ruminococcaceae bacterium OttesenSCG-928-L11]